MTIWWLAYPLLGIFGGFVAGLFGVGGGLTLVPFMFMIFTAQHFPPEHVMHLSLGTSMATIVFTSLSSMRAHHAHGAVRWDIVRHLAPGLVLGTFSGSLVAGQVPTGPMTAIFVVIVYYAQGAPAIARPGRAVRGGRVNRCGLQSGRGGWRFSVDPLHVVLQCCYSCGSWHFVGAGLSDCRGRCHRLHRRRLERYRFARLFARLYLPAGVRRHRHDECAGCAVRRQAGAQAASQEVEAGVWCLSRSAGQQDVVQPDRLKRLEEALI